jgi:hypothetical protein
MIPKSCPLSDKGKLHVTLHAECIFIREGQDPFNEMCEGCSFNPEVIRERQMSGMTAKDYKSLLDGYIGLLFTKEEKEVLAELEKLEK